MADPISLMAVASLIFAGRTLSKPHKTVVGPSPEVDEAQVLELSLIHI